ncbi:MAG: hypothetical protein P8Q35_04705 [Candidatus Thalassarchaeaceae archaeon]|nr:hypothetical protein [Candidatus Thalassarchaeaceae archaeon]PDH24037.1 MAG: hypothetical protein CND29_02945 [Marine Group II euryarchaeote MED-G36]
MSEEYRIQELLQREVYVGDTLVGIITGERSHPRDEFVKSMRLEVVDNVAGEFMRKPAGAAPLSKELVHSIRPDGGVKLSKSMRELQRRWRNTIRIDEQLWAPDELLDRAVMDNDGIDLGNVVGFMKVKRTYRGVIINTHAILRRKYQLPEQIVIPVKQLARTTAFLDELILRCTAKRLVTLPSYITLNGIEIEE